DHHHGDDPFQSAIHRDQRRSVEPNTDTATPYLQHRHWQSGRRPGGRRVGADLHSQPDHDHGRGHAIPHHTPPGEHLMTSRVNDAETLPVHVEHASGVSMLLGRFWRFVQRALVYVVLIVVSIVMVAPFYFLVAGSLMDRGEMFQIPPRLWPSEPIWDNYRTIFTDYAFAT